MILGEQQLIGISNCPNCGVANPMLRRVWSSEDKLKRQDEGKTYRWAAYSCTTCSYLIVAAAESVRYSTGTVWEVVVLYPKPRKAKDDIPEPARTFLQQAFNTLHAPDAAGVMAGSAVDAMLKAKGYEDGSLYVRIDKALDDHLLTQGMADWAHSVRLGSNRPRHSDKETPHLTNKEARQSVEFAEALGEFLFVLTAQIQQGIESSGGSGTAP